MTETNVVTVDGKEFKPLTENQARELTAKIYGKLDQAWELIKEAYYGRAWIALGYASWDEYCQAEFEGAWVRLPREKRREQVVTLAQAGLSTRAIAAATGSSHATVSRDLASVTGSDETVRPDAAPDLDGKVRTKKPRRSKPAPKPVPQTEPEPEVIEAEIVEFPTPAAIEAVPADEPEPVLTAEVARLERPRRESASAVIKRTPITDIACELARESRQLGERLNALRRDSRFRANRAEIREILRRNLDYLEDQLFNMMRELPHPDK